jgi:indole-3-acetate monooxygenase
LIETADIVAAALAGRSAGIEAARRLPADVVGLLQESGLLRMLTPAALGGPELHPAAFFDTVERLARADASVAWCSFIASTSALIAAWLPQPEAQALFGDPDVKAAGVFAPRGKAVREGDGFHVSGRWAWGSGMQYADVAVVGCLVPGEESRGVLSVVVPASAVHCLDNWTSMGLCGTGSGEFEVDGTWVPSSHTARLTAPPVQPGALYRFPVFGLLALAIAATASGIARAALDELISLADAKVPMGGQRPLAQRATVQDAVARAEGQWRAARAFQHEAIAAAWAQATADGSIQTAARRDLRLASSHLVHAAAAVVDRMHTLAGGNAIFAASPLQRCLRDVHVATQHMMVGESTFELTGRLLLGQPTDVAML